MARPETPAERAVLDAFAYIRRFPAGTPWSLSVDHDNTTGYSGTLSVAPVDAKQFWLVCAELNRMPREIGDVSRTLRGLEIEVQAP